jgi:hypothetical protein
MLNKKISFSTVWHKSLAKPRSNLHKKPWERNKFMFILFHFLKTYIRNPSLLFMYFSTLPPCLETMMPTMKRVYIYTLEDDFSQIVKNHQVFCQTVWQKRGLRNSLIVARENIMMLHRVKTVWSIWRTEEFSHKVLSCELCD